MGALPTLSLLGALIALGGSPQRPPTPDELRLFDEGTHALAAGDARGAEKAWRAGYEIGHDPAFLVHIGEAEEKAGAPAEAAESYRRYLREAPDAADRPDIEQRIARLAPAAPTPPVAAATSAAAAETPGEFGGTAPLAAAPPPGAPGPAHATAKSAVHVDGERPSASDEEDSGWTRYNITAVVAAGVTAALLGTAAFFGAEASSNENDLNRLVTYRYPPPLYSSVAAEYQSAMTDGPRQAHDAKVALIAAAGAGVVAAVFFVLDGVHAPAHAAAPAISLGPAEQGRGALGAWSWRF